MKILSAIFITITSFSLFSCTHKPIPSETKITKSTRIISQTDDSLVMSYLKDTSLLVFHENEFHNAPVMQFNIANNTSKEVKFQVTPYNWLSSPRYDVTYSDGRSYTNIGCFLLDISSIGIESHSTKHFYYPKEDSLIQLKLYLKYHSDSSEKSKYKEVEIEIGS
jgi:hypothetical protein